MYDQIEQQLKEQETASQKSATPNPGEKPVTDKTVTDDSEKEKDVQNNGQSNASNADPEGSVQNNGQNSVQNTGQSDNTSSDEPSGEKEWYEVDDEPKKDPVKPNVTETPVEDEDEDIKLLKEFKKSGKSLRDFVKEFDVPDYATLDEVKIVEIGLKEIEGFEGEDYNAAVEEFNALPIFQRKRLVEEYRNTLVSRNEDKLKRLTSAPTQQKVEAQKTLVRFEAEVDSLAKQLSGKEIYGLTVTDEMSSKIKSYLTKEISLNRQDGSIDADLLADFALWKLYGKDIVRTNVTKAKNSGRKEVLEVTTNPSSGKGPSNMSRGQQGLGVDDAFNSWLSTKKR
jgi:hypothetical protein